MKSEYRSNGVYRKANNGIMRRAKGVNGSSEEKVMKSDVDVMKKSSIMKMKRKNEGGCGFFLVADNGSLIFEMAKRYESSRKI